MFTLSLANFVLGLTMAGLFGMAGLWFYYDRRDRRYYDNKRTLHAHYCVRCDSVYANRTDAAAAPCPQCGHPNGRMKF